MGDALAGNHANSNRDAQQAEQWPGNGHANRCCQQELELELELTIYTYTYIICIMYNIHNI